MCDIVLAAHSGLMSGLHLQLSAICAGGKVEATLFNAGDSTVDVPAGQLRVIVTKVRRWCEFLLAVVREMRVHRPGNLRRLAPSAVQRRTLFLIY